MIAFNFHITYDGITEPINYQVIIEEKFNENNSLKICDETVREYLSSLLNEESIEDINDSRFILISIGDVFRLHNVCPIDPSKKQHISIDDNEKYISDVIKYIRSH